MAIEKIESWRFRRKGEKRHPGDTEKKEVELRHETINLTRTPLSGARYM
jgi:hypothetical protein